VLSAKRERGKNDDLFEGLYRAGGFSRSLNFLFRGSREEVHGVS
jgi:hypothetical protein